MEVSALIEAMPKVSGYKVHKDKLARLGVPILLQHTIISANSGKDKAGVVSATIAQVDFAFKVVPGTEKTVPCDTILVAAGLSSCDEFYRQAKGFGLKVFMAGDAEEIAEASAALFGGKLAAVRIANSLGRQVATTSDYSAKMDVLKSKPGKIVDRTGLDKRLSDSKVYPVLHCYEEIPCNPCITACSQGLLKLTGNSLMDIPYFDTSTQNKGCSGCNRCVVICPGLAVSVVDKRKAPDGKAFVYLPFELIPNFKVGDTLEALDNDGNFVVDAEVKEIINRKWQDRRLLIKLLVDERKTDLIAGFKYQKNLNELLPAKGVQRDDPDKIVCRCEKVSDRQVREMIKSGVTDMNSLKIIRCMMGACGGKTCTPLIKRIFAQEGFDLNNVSEPTMRPLNAEVKLGAFAGLKTESEPNYESDI